MAYIQRIQLVVHRVLTNTWLGLGLKQNYVYYIMQ